MKIFELLEEPLRACSCGSHDKIRVTWYEATWDIECTQCPARVRSSSLLGALAKWNELDLREVAK